MITEQPVAPKKTASARETGDRGSARRKPIANTIPDTPAMRQAVTAAAPSIGIGKKSR